LPSRERLVLAAREFSPGALELLADADINWADETGWARIVGPAGLIVIRHHARRERSRPDDFSWSPAALSVAEGILELPAGPLRVAPLGERLGWSTAQIANVLAKFDEQGWTVKRGPSRGPSAHRELVDQDTLLVAWADAMAKRPVVIRSAHRPLRDPIEFLRSRFAPAAAAASVEWGATGWAGLELAAPFVTTAPTLQLYIENDQFGARLGSLLREIGLHETEEGAGNIELRRADRDELAWVVVREGLPVVGPSRLFCDLRRMGGRGLDAAGHVRDELIQGDADER
jgi:hypothetical protein